MIIHWTWVLAALVILVPPPILSSELRKVVISARRNATLNVASLARPWQNWVDFGRGLIGTIILTQLAVVPDLATDSGPKTTLVHTAILSLTLLIQVFRWDGKVPQPEHRLQLLTPVFYLSGVTLGFNDLLIGGFAVAAGWTFAVAGKNPIFQMPTMAIGLAGAGYVFGLSLSLYCTLMLISIPYLPAFALRKRMVFVGAEKRWPQPVLKSEAA